MLQVSTKPPEPVWIDLPGGARIRFKPLGTSGKAVGSGMLGEVVQAGEGMDVASVAYVIGCARWGAEAWEGVGDEDGAPLELTPESVAALLEQNDGAFTAVQQNYVLPALRKDAEKNVSAPSPRGGSPASGRKTGQARAPRSAAVTTAAPARKPAKPAPPKKTAPKAKTARRPGG